jgi:hypothetical protein
MRVGKGAQRRHQAEILFRAFAHPTAAAHPA